jgi:2-methylcitrate dehydratase
MNASAPGATAHQRLAALVHDVRFDGLPADVVNRAKSAIVDSLGCLIGGFAGGPTAAVRNVVADFGGRPASTVIGTTTKTSAPLAALANGTALRYLDFNDACVFDRPGGNNTGHPSGNLPVALAMAEAYGRSGRDVIAALVAAYEVQMRLCEYAGEPSLRKRGWHNTTNLAFSTAAAAARLIKDDPALIAQAMAIAVSHQHTLSQLQEGAMATIKASADGWVAKAGVEAAALAAAGLTGPEQLFEGKAGWEKAVAGVIDYDGLLAPLGDFRILKANLKPFAAVGPAQAPIQAAVDVFQSGRVKAGEVEKIVVRVPAVLLESPNTSEARRYPQNKETADHSIFYCVAIALLEGNCSEEQYVPEKLASPAVRDLLAKVSIIADEELTALNSGGAVAVHLRGGQVAESRYTVPPGHPRNPLNDAQIGLKFDGLTSHYYSEARRAAIKQAVRNLDRADRIDDLIALLAPDVHPRG